MARCGIPQGSALSSTLSEFTVSQVIADLGLDQQYPLVNYCDNFGFLCDASETQRLEQTLRAGFASHPAGPFELTISRRPIASECRFLGYSFCREASGKCKFWVRESDWQARYAFFADKLQNGPVDCIPNVIRRMDSYISSWPRWEGRHEPRAMWQRLVRSVLEDRQCMDMLPASYEEIGAENSAPSMWQLSQPVHQSYLERPILPIPGQAAKTERSEL